MRSATLAVLSACALACASRRAAPPAAAVSAARAEVGALERELLEARFRRFPERATALGFPAADHGAVMDASPAALTSWQAEEDRYLSRARAIDPRTLAGTREELALQVLVEALEGSRGARVCHSERWAVPSLLGGQPEHAPLVEVQPVGTPERRAAALARVSALARRVDYDIENLRQGVRSGHVATRENVERIAAELDRLLATPPASWPHVRPALRDDDPAFRVQLAAAIERDLVPAADRYRVFLRTEYLERARRKPSLLALPGGEACYRAEVRRHVTLEPEPAALHATGLARVQAVQAEMRVIAERAFGTSNVQVLLQRLREDPAFRSRDARELVATSRAAVDRAAAAAPRWFGKTTRAPVDVRELPEMLRGSGPVGRRGSDVSSGKLVGLYFLTAPGETGQERAVVEAAAFHATIPGHHLQLAMALEGGGAPDAGRYLPNDGFAEGWALYAERLAGEMGLYSDDLSRLGALAREALCAAGLVADSGLNVFAWPRQRAIDYLVANAGVSPASAASEVDRYAAAPGEAAASTLGMLEISRLRAEAEHTLGARFDVRAFHEAVLEDGAVTLPMLRAKIARLVEASGPR